jgi:hypothetical protein
LGRGPTESWRARLSRAWGGPGVDREPARNPESRPTTNESWRAGVSIRACGATQPASKGHLRRCSPRGKERPATLLNRREGAAHGAAQPAERGGRRATQPASQKRHRVVPGAAGARAGGFRYAPAALVNPRARDDCGAAQPDLQMRHLVVPGRAVPETTGARAGGGRVSIRACGATQPAGRGRPAALLNRLGGAVCCGPRSAWVCCIVRRLRAVGECFT